jgi:hypothetical protein
MKPKSHDKNKALNRIPTPDNFFSNIEALIPFEGKQRFNSTYSVVQNIKETLIHKTHEVELRNDVMIR